MDKKYFSPIAQSKNLFLTKTMMPKNQILKRQNEGIFSSSNAKKYIPDEQSSKLILNYFQFNNFQDFNTWQQIAKTKTQYKFEETSTDKFQCQLSFKWQLGLNQAMIFKSTAGSKKNAKKKALILLIEALIFKGLIGNGFKQKNFIQKLPRRKKYDSSSSEEDDKNQVSHLRRVSTLNALKEKKFQEILQNISLSNVHQIWSYAISTRNLQFCDQVLVRIFCSQSQSIKEERMMKQYDCTGKKQVSYVEQFKDPCQEDLTVFIRYYQLQRSQDLKSNFNQHPTNSQKCTEMSLPSFLFSEEILEKGLKSDAFREFKTIEHAHQEIIKRRKKIDKKVKRGFFQQLQEISLPKFQEDKKQQQKFSVKLIQKMFNQVLFISNDYQFAINVLDLFVQRISDSYIAEFCHQPNKKSQQKIPIPKQENKSKSSQSYYFTMKKNLLLEMIFNLQTKIKPEKLAKNLSIEGMINFASANSKFQGIFQFVSKESQDLMVKKIQKKNNYNQFFQQNQFCTEEMVLLVNKINQSTYLGIVLELSQSFKIYVPHLLFESENEFPAPFTIYKLLNNKIYNKLSAALIHTCKHNIQLVNYEIEKNKNVCVILENPSGPHLEIIEQIIAQLIGKKMFILIVSENYEILHKVLTDKGFKSLKISITTDQKAVSKSNVILASPLNVCLDSMRNVAFDSVIIDEAQRVPQIISLLSTIKCTKKLYLIGDPNLPRSEMKSTLSKNNSIEKSLFEKYLQKGCEYLTFTNQKLHPINDSNTKKYEIVYDFSIVEWLKMSVYENQIITELEDSTKKKTPSIKGFNWPSNDHRLCFINSPFERQKYQKWVNSQCELIVWIIAQVLKSGFTQLQQITCCCIDTQLIPLLQHHLLKILYKLNIKPLQWSLVFQSLIKPLNGSRWNSNDLIIVLGVYSDCQNHQNQQQSYGGKQKIQDNVEMGKKLNSALLQAQRGLIIVGDVDLLSVNSSAWKNFIDWMAHKKLILSYNPSI